MQVSKERRARVDPDFAAIGSCWGAAWGRDSLTRIPAGAWFFEGQNWHVTG